MTPPMEFLSVRTDGRDKAGRFRYVSIWVDPVDRRHSASITYATHEWVPPSELEGWLRRQDFPSLWADAAGRPPQEPYPPPDEPFVVDGTP